MIHELNKEFTINGQDYLFEGDVIWDGDQAKLRGKFFKLDEDGWIKLPGFDRYSDSQILEAIRFDFSVFSKEEQITTISDLI